MFNLKRDLSHKVVLWAGYEKLVRLKFPRPEWGLVSWEVSSLNFVY